MSASWISVRSAVNDWSASIFLFPWFSASSESTEFDRKLWFEAGVGEVEGGGVKVF